MDLLWKRETRHENAMYIDIFRKTHPDLRYMCGFDDKKEYFHMTENMISMYVHSEKSEEQSIVYRKRGDLLFQQSKWYEAMKYYNRCLCLAKVGTEHMGIGYAKRAQCFFQLKMYEKCLMDLDLARFSNFPRQQYALLEMREAECLKRIAEGIEAESFVPKLSLEPSKKFPEMANVLKIVHNPKANWYIVSTTDIKVGEIVMIEKSFVATYNESYQKCSICSVSFANLVPCNKCSKVLLCPDCNGSILHQVECDAQVLFSNNYPPVSDTFRSILLAMTLFEDADELINFVESIVATDLSDIPQSIHDQKTKYRGFLQMTQNTIDMKEDPPIAFINYTSLMGHATVNQYFHTEQHRRFLIHLVFHHFSALKIRGLNSIARGFDNVTEETDYSLILSTNFEHSCAPHLTLRMVDGFAVMITCRPIKKGQRITLSQNEMIIMNNVKERQKELQEEFGYECKCERCKLENDMSNIPDPRLLADRDFQFIIQQLNSNSRCDEQHSDQLAKCSENFLNKYGHHKWNEALDIAFLTYYCSIKKICEQTDTLL